MVKSWGYVKLIEAEKRKQRQLEQLRLAKLKQYQFKKKNPNSKFLESEYSGRFGTPVIQNQKQPFEAQLDENHGFNPFEHRPPSEVYGDPFLSHDGVQLTLLDVDKGTKSKGRTGNLFGF